MRYTRQILAAAILVAVGCNSEAHRLGGDYPGLGAAGESNGSDAPSGSGGTSGTPEAARGTHTVFLDQIIPGPGRCLPRRLEVGPNGGVSCVIVEATVEPSCGLCSRPGRRPASPQMVAAGRRQLGETGYCGPSTARGCEDLCFCELDQLMGAAAVECLTRSVTSVTTPPGWCYVDADQGVGSPDLLVGCPGQWKRLLRFVGDTVLPGAVTLLGCVDSTDASGLGPDRAGQIGDSCTSSAESDPSFQGFSPEEVSVEVGSRQCASGPCVVNHFQGRVSCPYGQSEQELASGPLCTLPQGGGEVEVVVAPQRSGRRAPDTVYCSCRCGGAGAGPFCSCPAGYACIPTVTDLGISLGDELAGSYCVKQGAEYDPTQIGEPCQRTQQNCE